MAILLFAVDIYGLNLPSFLVDITLFKMIPTPFGPALSAVICFLPGHRLDVCLSTVSIALQTWNFQTDLCHFQYFLLDPRVAALAVFLRNFRYHPCPAL